MFTRIFCVRLHRLDEVGICLDKETDKSTVMASSTVLRRSSYNKQAKNGRRGSHLANDDDDISVISGPLPDDDDMSVSSQGSRMVPPPRLSSVKH